MSTHARSSVQDQPQKPDSDVEEAFERLVDEGETRLARPFLPLVVTALLGGVDIAVGLIAYLVVDNVTDSPLAAGAAFSVGFVVLTLARGELFTENFLVPVTAAVAGRGSIWQLMRLWIATLTLNLAGGWVMAGLIITARPDLKATARTAGEHYAHLGATGRSFCLAILAGAVITLMTRMQHATDSLGVKVATALLMGTVLAGAQLFHCVLDSLLMFTALWSHADFGYGSWLGALAWSGLGNLVGGVGLVSGLRLLRVSHRIAEERQDTDTDADTATATDKPGGSARQR